MTDFIIQPANSLSADVDTLIFILLDGSTSMGSIRGETVDGLNAFVEKQPKSGPNSKTLISVSVFKSNWSKLELDDIRTNVDVSEWKPISKNEYNPNGWTPLFDAITTTVPAVNKFVQTSPNPPAVLFVIVTDGENNRSSSTKQQVAALIKEMETDQKWTFVFLGANQDAFSEGSGMGISAGNTRGFVAGAVHDAFASVGDVAASYTLSNTAMRSTNKSAKYATMDSFAEAGQDNTETIK